MRMNKFWMTGIAVGIAALALRRRSRTHCRSGEENFNVRDATLLGTKAHLTDVGGRSASHIKKGVGRSVAPNVPAV